MEQLSLFQPLDRTERQKEGIRAWIKAGCCGTLTWATGVGKSRAAIMAINVLIGKYKDLKVLIIVPTETLKSQWENHIFTNNLTYNCTVMVINSAIKESRECDLLVIDELHRCGSDTFSKVFTFKYKYILGLTATLERLDGKHELISKYCPEVDRITSAEAIFNGWLAENIEYKVMLDVPDIEVYKNLTKEFNEHFEFFQFKFDLAMSMLGKEGYIKRSQFRDELCKLNPRLDRTETFKLVTYHATALARVLQARKKFINEHPKKIELTREIIKYRPDAKIITFSATTEIAEKIGMGEVYTGKVSKKKGRTTIEAFAVKQSGVLHTVKKCDEGLDCPGINLAIMLGYDSSPTRYIQRKGRAIRKEGSKISEIFTFVINDTVENEWFNKSHEKETKIITIDETNLLKVLKGEEFETYKRPTKKFTFRF